MRARTSLSLVVLLVTALPAAAVPRVLLVGDSWAQGIQVTNAFNEVIEARGGEGDAVFGADTAIGGTQLHHWVSETPKEHKQPGGSLFSGLASIDQALEKHPTIDVVHLILGGNDVLGLIKSGKPSEAAWETRKQRIQKDLELLVDRLLAKKQIKAVVLQDYSYLNAQTAGRTLGCLQPGDWGFGGMTQEQVSRYFVEAGRIKMDVAQSREGCHYLHNFGRLQRHFGAPEGAPAPGDAATGFEPFPGGDIRHPVPDAAFDPVQLGDCPKDGPAPGDGIHINEAAHKILLEHAAREFYDAWLRLNPAS